VRDFQPKQHATLLLYAISQLFLVQIKILNSSSLNMPSYQESDLQQAILAVDRGVPKLTAAKQYGVPRTTLSARLKGVCTKKQYDNDRQSLSPEEELDLAAWCRIQHMLGIPPTHRQIRLAAQRMLLVSGSDVELGKTWTVSFLRRNPSVRALRGERLEKSCAEGVTPDKIKKVLAIFEEPVIKAIRAQTR
jgi:hypothetical protein